MSSQKFYEKIVSLNETIIGCLNETDEVKIIKAFTELGIRVLEASFGFVWFKSEDSDGFKLMYKSPDITYEPKPPRQGGRNYAAILTRTPQYVSDPKKQPDTSYVSAYMQSFVIIPILHGKNVYGNIVLCFSKREAFPEEKKVLCSFIGNSVADAITIRRLMLSDHERLLFEEEKKRTQFIADAAHELRTPLAIIKGNVDLALQVGVKSLPEARKTLRAIDHEVRHLTGLISDMSLLRSSGAAAGRRLSVSTVSLRAIVSRAAERCAAFAADKRIAIRVARIPDISISGDEMHIDKLFANIIKNAVVYGKIGGRVDIGVVSRGRRAHVYIRDNGIGISKNDLPHISERFYRTAAARASNADGTGLGLAIAKWIVEAHGGAMRVTSVEGEGTVFKVSLPALAAKPSRKIVS